MYDIDLKNVKKGKNFYYIFLVMGIIFAIVIGGVFVFETVRPSRLDASTLSTSVDVNSHKNSEGNTMYSTSYNYEVRGEEYTCSSSASSSVYPKQKNKLVYYNSSDPSDCKPKSSTLLSLGILAFLLIPIIFILVGGLSIKKVNKRIKLINELNQTGKLVKNLPYRLEKTGTVVNNQPILRPVVDYTLPSGSVIQLFGDPRHDRKNFDADGMVDLLIDENNPDNYYIDFEINRLSGNLSEDYYEQKNQK